MEPTPQDIAAVQSAMGEQPQPAPQQQPAQPTSQPAPQSQPADDPFAAFGQPAEPAAPPAQPTQPVEPAQPVQPTEPAQQPAQPAQPTDGQPQPVQAAPQGEQPQTYEEYVASVMEGVPAMPERPDPSKINPDDPDAIKGFFDELFSSAEQRFEANYARKEAFKTAENKLWNEAMDKYPSLRTNNQLRDTVHAIRRTEFAKGRAVTPIQAAQTLLSMMQGQYQQGVADNQVQTTITEVQPQGGGGTTVPTTMDGNTALERLQTGGEQALAEMLDARFKAGQ